MEEETLYPELAPKDGDQSMEDLPQPNSGSDSDSDSEDDDEAQDKLHLQNLENELAVNPSNYDAHAQVLLPLVWLPRK